jgi:hypothetical protein
MIQHPTEVRGLGFDRYAVKRAGWSVCCRKCGADRPSPVSSTELDHHVAVGRSLDGFKDVYPLEVLIVE